MKKIEEQRKSSAIRNKTLKQMRDMRRMLDRQCPEALEGIRALIGDGASAEKNTMDSGGETIKIDRRKNMETVFKLMEMKPHANGLKQGLKKILE